MATLRHSIHLPFPSLHLSSKSHQTQNFNYPIFSKHPKITLNQTRFILKAAEKEPENSTITNQEASSEEQQLSELGTEIKKAMKERDKVKEDSGFFSGVVDEIGQIEWPDFGKVVGITGVVLGVIAGSSVVLLTVNGVLAELSDKVFAGKGVQDFFGG
ncbi:hypothetical protein SOVF_096630 [Spinacia oleracea]|uniref:Preprotein translocase subunit SECE1 n=1 Tax=Spinacia oleracea TaxID=3562 RepID=A0A9R0K0R2_SPIOL|nr:preprotein translocase subunit SECE1 [Spinacia oleracea]KNA15615.1 hypothetical protein SOVF_096630 [Spinacia oleracea]